MSEELQRHIEGTIAEMKQHGMESVKVGTFPMPSGLSIFEDTLEENYSSSEQERLYEKQHKSYVTVLLHNNGRFCCILRIASEEGYKTYIKTCENYENLRNINKETFSLYQMSVAFNKLDLT